MARLTFAEVDQLFQLNQTGGVARVNHSTSRCEGQSRSLRIVPNDEGGYNFKCFRCPVWGSVYPSALAKRRAALSRGDRPEPEQEDHRLWRTEYPPGETNPVKWSKAARQWLLQYLTIDAVQQWGAVEAHDRLWLPATVNGVPVKWPGRRLYSEDSVKYLTGQLQTYETHDPVGTPTEGSRLIIVEDLVSAWVIAQTLELPAWPVLSTSVTPYQYHSLAKYATFHGLAGVTVWLDNDNAQVNKAARTMARNLRGYGESVCVYRDLQDPKRALVGMAYSQYPAIRAALEAS